MVKTGSESQDVICKSFGLFETDSIFQFLNSVSENIYGENCNKGVLEFCTGSDLLVYVGKMFEYTLENLDDENYSSNILLAYIYRKVHSEVIGDNTPTKLSERCNAILRNWYINNDKDFDFVLPTSTPVPL